MTGNGFLGYIFARMALTCSRRTVSGAAPVNKICFFFNIYQIHRGLDSSAGQQTRRSVYGSIIRSNNIVQNVQITTSACVRHILEKSLSIEKTLALHYKNVKKNKQGCINLIVR
jgi:hypothetical protein